MKPPGYTLPKGRRGALALLMASAAGQLLMAPTVRAADDVVVIVHPDNPNPVDMAFVLRVYNGALKGWPDGSPVFLLDQPEDSEARRLFVTTVLGKSVAHQRALWSQIIFTGKGLPPRVVGPDAEMKRIVAANRHALGYIRASQLDASVRAVPR